MKWLPLLSLILANMVEPPSPVVLTTGGLVRGTITKNGKFHQYFGVPYGLVDDTNRFQAPKPVPKWQGIFEAIDVNSRCPQKMLGTVYGEGDCLKLFVYTPANRDHVKLPVMVFIHGGAFFEGAGSTFLYGGDYFAEHGVVFVGINYRLSVEGFLCLGIKEAPGNAGLKDQIAALNWVQENIEAFGGDPNKVTLFGESAGSVSTSLLVLSSAAKGLFHQVVLQSGSTLSPWALQHDPITTASLLVKEFGYNTKDPHEIYSILSKKSIEEIITSIKYKKHRNYITADILFGPCVEKEVEDVAPILTKHPIDVIESGNYTKVPMIIGFNDKEALYFVAKNYGTNFKHINVDETLMKDLLFPDKSDRQEIVERLKTHYFSTPKENIAMDLMELYSDLHFKFPIAIESELYARTTNQPLYYYLFKYSGYINMPKVISSFGLVKGACHADELFYLFMPHTFPLPWRVLETSMIERMVTMWTNFAKFGDPTPNTSGVVPVRWLPSRAPIPQALVIDARLSTAPLWDESAMVLWNHTYTKYRRKNYVSSWSESRDCCSSHCMEIHNFRNVTCN